MRRSRTLKRRSGQSAPNLFQLGSRALVFSPNHELHEFSGSEYKREGSLPRLAKTIDEAAAKIGIPKEDRAFSPHLTLARTRGGSGAPGRRKDDKTNRQFAKLHEFLATRSAPDFGTMTAREFFLYRSQLSSTGSQYTKIARFDLRPEIT